MALTLDVTHLCAILPVLTLVPKITGYGESYRNVLARDESSRYCHDVRPSVRLSICLFVWDGRALCSYDALWGGFKFMVR